MVERAVKGMLPKNRLGRQMYKKLFVYTGSEHPHLATKTRNNRRLNNRQKKRKLILELVEERHLCTCNINTRYRKN